MPAEIREEVVADTLMTTTRQTFMVNATSHRDFAHVIRGLSAQFVVGKRRFFTRDRRLTRPDMLIQILSTPETNWTRQ
jgi:hypothetical protein